MDQHPSTPSGWRPRKNCQLRRTCTQASGHHLQRHLRRTHARAEPDRLDPRQHPMNTQL
jgi:hypothetical protein